MEKEEGKRREEYLYLQNYIIIINNNNNIKEWTEQMWLDDKSILISYIIHKGPPNLNKYKIVNIQFFINY